MISVSNHPSKRLLYALERLAVHDHLCLIYETQEEQLATAIPFIKLGLERGEYCLYITNENSTQDIIDSLNLIGLDAERFLKSGSLSITTPQETYLKQGSFDPDWMIEFLRQKIVKAKADGFSALRLTAEMTWALQNIPGSNRLMEYEAKLNALLPRYDCLAICQYHRTRFNSVTLTDALYTHPFIIKGGVLAHNHYYVPPEDFLEPDAGEREVERLLNNIISHSLTEEALRESDVIRNEAESIANIGSYVLDLRDNELRWSKNMFALAEISPKDFMGKFDESIERIAHKDDLEYVNAQFKAMIAQKKTWPLDFRIVRPSGEIRFWRSSSRFIFDETGKPILCVGVHL